MKEWSFRSAKSEFGAYAKDWDRLNRALCCSHPYFDSRFVGALIDHFATGHEILCLYREDGVVSGALILQPCGWGRWSSFRPSQAQITAVLLDDPRLLQSLLRSLPGRAWTIELLAIDPRYSPLFQSPDMANIVSAQAYTIGVSPNQHFETYWNQRPKKLKANMQRYFNRFEREFGLPTLVRIVDEAKMAIGVKRFGDVESAGWKGAAGTAISRDNAQGAFYSDVMHRFASTDQAAVYEIDTSNGLAASRLVIESERMSVFLKTTYDETLAHIAPGRIMLHQVIQERLTNRPGQSIEFYTNATRDQKEWATFGCTIQNVQVFRNVFLANSFAVLKAIKYSADPASVTSTVPEEISLASFQDVASLKASEIALEDFAPVRDIDMSLDWFELLHQAVYRNDSGVRYFHAIDSNRKAVVLPLRFAKQGWVKSIEALSNFYTSIYSPLQTPGSDGFVLRHILATATRERGNVHVMRFAPMDPSSRAYAHLLNELRAIGWTPFSFRCFGNWYVNIKDNWDGYLKRRSANMRSTIKRRTKEFAAAGGVLEVITAIEDVDRAICAFQEVYSASWKAPEPYPEFIPSLIHKLAAIGALRLGIACLNGKPVAAQLWIVCGSKASIFKLAYHEDYAAYSPGTVLTGHLMRHVIEQDHVTEVDFLKGDDTHKRIWMSARRERLGIVAYNPATITGFFLLAKEVLWRLAKRVSPQKVASVNDKAVSQESGIL